MVDAKISKESFQTIINTNYRQLIRALILFSIILLSIARVSCRFGSITAQSASIYLDRYRRELIVLHLFSFSSWFGCSIWVSFVGGIIMFKNLPRHVFGRLQSKLFPAYFKFSTVMVTLAILSAAPITMDGTQSCVNPSINQNCHSRSHWIPIELIIIISTVLLNLFVLEPKTTRVMYLRHAVEKRLGTGHEVGQLKPDDPTKANDQELKKLSKIFGKLHGISSLLNLVTLGYGCVWIVLCAGRIN